MKRHDAKLCYESLRVTPGVNKRWDALPSTVFNGFDTPHTQACDVVLVSDFLRDLAEGLEQGFTDTELACARGTEKEAT